MPSPHVRCVVYPSGVSIDELVLFATKMRLLRWLLLLPVAILVGMVGSVTGGVVAMLFGQTAADTGSAFLGPFAFVFAAGLVAPSHRQKVAFAAAALVTLLALGTFVLSTFTNVDEFARLSHTARILTPVAQFLGALYALVIFSSVVKTGATLESLWREVLTLGVLVAMFGATLAIMGLVVWVIGRGWLVLGVGVGVLCLAAVTWLFPFVHPLLRLRSAKP